MTVTEKETLSEFISTYMGSSFPTLARTESGRLLVVKMVGSGNGARSLISEFIVNNVSTALGWPVPSASLVKIKSDMPWTFGTDEFDDLVQKSSGWNLGLSYIDQSQKIADSTQVSISDDFKSQVLALDYLFVNIDRTVKSGNLLEDQNRQKWIVDHGSCLVFQTMKPISPRIDSHHIFYQDYTRLKNKVDYCVQKLKDFEGFQETLNKVPMQWCELAGVTPKELRDLVGQVIGRPL